MEISLTRLQAESCDGDWDEPCARCVRLVLPCTMRWAFNNTNTKGLKNELRVCDSRNRTSFVNDLGQRLLLWAADYGQLRIVELLIEIGVDVDTKDKNDYTSLHLSVRKSHLLIVRALLDANASVTAESESVSTALHWAASSCGDENIIRSLLEAGAAINTSDKSYFKDTPLHVAVDKNHCRAIEVLLAGGANPDAQNSNGETPLFMAQSEGAINVLVRWGSRLTARDKWMRTPLHAAVEDGPELAALSAMLDAGADPNAVNVCRRTPLHNAAEHSTDSIELLLRNKADPNAKDYNGNTPLHISARKGYMPGFAALLRGGSDVYLRNQAFKTPVDVVVRDGNEDKIREMFRIWWEQRFGEDSINEFQQLNNGALYQIYLQQEHTDLVSIV
jgi:uncharacterized protein